MREVIGEGDTHRYLIHDRDSIFARRLDDSIRALRLTILRTPVRSPKANSICERVIGTVRRECLDRLIPMSEGPYYSPMGKRYLEDVLETMGEYIDSLKFAGGSFALMSRSALRELIGLAHRHNVLVSTGGFIEYVRGPTR